MNFRGRVPEKDMGSAKCAGLSPRNDLVNISGGCLQTKKMKSDDDIKNDVDEEEEKSESHLQAPHFPTRRRIIV